jgi:hypothetical protein
LQEFSSADSKLPLNGEKVEVALAFSYNSRKASAEYFHENSRNGELKRFLITHKQRASFCRV